MRRKEKEVLDKEVINKVLESEIMCRVALCDGDTPYVVPMNYAYKDNCIYLHSAIAGRKIDVLSRNNKVCIEVDSKAEIIPAKVACGWTCHFISVIAFGTAELVESREEKIEGLNILMEKYSGVGSHEYNDRALDKVGVIKVTLNEITGKRSNP